MTARTPATSGPPPVPRGSAALAADVAQALHLLRRTQDDLAAGGKGPPERLPLAMLAHDLGVTCDDVDLVLRDLEGLAR